MPSTLEVFRLAVETLWEATTPPSSVDTSDASGIAYAFATSLDEELTPGRHRQLVWGRTAQRRYIMEPVGGPGTGQVESTLDVYLSLASASVSTSIAAAPSLGAGVIAAHLDEIVDDTSSVAPPKPRAGTPRASIGSISRVRFTLRVLHEV